MFVDTKVLNELAESKGYDCKALAKTSGVSQRAVKGLLSGEIKNPTKSTVERLSNALGVSVGDITLKNLESVSEKNAVLEEPAKEEPAKEEFVKEEPAEEKDKLVYIKIHSRKHIDEDVNECIVRSDMLLSLRKDNVNLRIWIAYENGFAGKGFSLSEYFGTADELDERWSYLTECLTEVK